MEKKQDYVEHLTKGKKMSPNTVVGQVPVAEIDYDSYLPRKWGDEYIQINNEAEELEQFILEAKFPYLIEGEKGMGKTLLITDIALKHNIPMITLSCSNGTRMSDLEGRIHVNDNGSYFQLGVMPLAIELANHFGHAILFMDEINALEHSLQKRTNPILDERKEVYVNGKLYKLNKDCKLSCVAAMNPVTYTGVNTLNEDMKSRFIGRTWNNTIREQLKDTIDWKDIDDKLKEQIIVLCENMRSLRIKGDISYSLSTRDIKQFITVLKMYAKGQPIDDEVITKTLRTCVINHKLDSDEERKSVCKLVYDLMGIELEEQE